VGLWRTREGKLSLDILISSSFLSPHFVDCFPRFSDPSVVEALLRGREGYQLSLGNPQDRCFAFLAADIHAGLIFVVDSSDRDRIDEAKEELQVAS
jgi:hypothetical protein